VHIPSLGLLGPQHPHVLLALPSMWWFSVKDMEGVELGKLSTWRPASWDNSTEESHVPGIEVDLDDWINSTEQCGTSEIYWYEVQKCLVEHTHKGKTMYQKDEKSEVSTIITTQEKWSTSWSNPTTAASAHCGWDTRADSTSAVPIRCPLNLPPKEPSQNPCSVKKMPKLPRMDWVGANS
jgi:hypothetical protein